LKNLVLKLKTGNAENESLEELKMLKMREPESLKKGVLTVAHTRTTYTRE